MFFIIGFLLIILAIAGYIITQINKDKEITYRQEVSIFEKKVKEGEYVSYDEKPFKPTLLPLPFRINKRQRNLSIFLGLLLISFSISNPFRVNQADERTVVQTIDGKLWTRFKPGFYWVGPFSKTTRYPNNVTLQVGPENKKSKETDYWTPSNTVTFSEGDKALMGTTVKWDLPPDDNSMVKLHKDYNGIDNLATTTLMQYQRETSSYSAQRLSSEEHYSGGQSQLKDYLQDQLRNGQILLETKTKVDTLGQGNTKQYVITQEKKDRNGRPLRTSSDIQKYNLNPSFVSVDYIKYDPRIYEKLKAKIDAASDEATAKQLLITAQQEALTAKAEGEKRIAETKAREEAKEQEEIIRARKERIVAQENVLRDKAKAASTYALKKAEADGDKLKVQAGLSPLEKAQIEKETVIGIAAELAKRDVPLIVSSGQGGQLEQTYQTKEMILLMDQLRNMGNKK